MHGIAMLYVQWNMEVYARCWRAILGSKLEAQRVCDEHDRYPGGVWLAA